MIADGSKLENTVNLPAYRDEQVEPLADGEGQLDFNWTWITAPLSELSLHWRVYPLVLVTLLCLAFLFLVVSHPVYTATAIIGPPGLSPTNTMLASVGSDPASSIARKMLSGGASGGQSNDPYQEYLQLLPSSRLAQALSAQPSIMTTIFYDRWDSEKNRWAPPGLLHPVTGPLKRLIHRPDRTQPNAYDLLKYLNDNMTMTRSELGGSSVLMPGMSSYNKVTFKYRDPRMAEVILDSILRETDRLIREDQRRDVAARIAVLRSELARPAISVDERSALISTLSSQEQVLSMIKADYRFASTLIVPPSSDDKPTFPPSPFVVAMVTVLFSGIAWVAFVVLGLRFSFTRRLLERFAHAPRQ
jgi:hypothetical protein